MGCYCSVINSWKEAGEGRLSIYIEPMIIEKSPVFIIIIAHCLSYNVETDPKNIQGEMYWVSCKYNLKTNFLSFWASRVIESGNYFPNGLFLNSFPALHISFSSQQALTLIWKDLLLIDLKKAIDCVWHNGLIFKLIHYSFPLT